MKRILVLLTLVLLASASAFATEEDWDAYIARELTPQTILLKGTAVARKPTRDLTIAMIQARRHWDELSPATKAIAESWARRPDDGGDGYVTMPAGCVDIRDTVHFRIHYIIQGCTSGAASTSYVDSVETALEYVYGYEVGTLGYTAPPADGDGGSTKYDVYLADVGSLGYYGYTMSESGAARTASYLVIDNDYSGFGYSNATVPMKVTVAHEFFHAIQMGGYDQFEDGAWMENTATWMETMAYPSIHDNYQYIGEPYRDKNADGKYTAGEQYTDRNGSRNRNSGSVDWPSAPLDAFQDSTHWTSTPLIQYGRFLWPQYLSEAFDADLIKEIWVVCGSDAGTGGGDNAFAAMNLAITARGGGNTRATAFHEYATWGYDTLQFGDGDNYPRVTVGAIANGNAGFTYSGQYYMSTIYRRINNPNGTYTFTQTGGAGTAMVSMLVVDSTCSIVREDLTLAGGTVDWTPAGTPSFAIAVISNVHASSTTSWSLSGGSHDPTSVPACAITVKNPVTYTDGGADSGGGGGALDLLALSIAGLLYARRRLG